ncbi:MAG: hypothetical protein M1820_002638 [Bogoriella megaspora]|nr:MAG: hypothetical protein M1820_002638 [Bogoriella megaspora]
MGFLIQLKQRLGHGQSRNHDQSPGQTTSSARLLENSNANTDIRVAASSKRLNAGSLESSHPYNLVNLPSEIIHSIASFLPSVSANALRMTCRNLYIRVENLEMDSASARMLMKWLSVDRYLKLCRDEKNGHSSQTHSSCCGCVDGHENKFFSATQLKRPPTGRVCTGLEREMRICRHVNLSLREIQRLCILHGATTQSQESGIDLCQSKAHRTNAYFTIQPQPRLALYPDSWTKAETKTLHYKAEVFGHYKLRNVCPDPFLSEIESVNGEDVEMLVGIKSQILSVAFWHNIPTCSHIGVRGNLALWRVALAFRRRYRILAMARRNRYSMVSKTPLESCYGESHAIAHPGKGPCVRWAKWECEQCSTILAVHQKSDNSVYLTVRRPIGYVDNPVNHQWLNQLSQKTQSGFRKKKTQGTFEKLLTGRERESKLLIGPMEA